MTLKKRVLVEAIDTSMFLLPELPGRVERLNIPRVRGRMIDGSDPFVSLVGASRLKSVDADATLQQIHERFAGQNKAYGWIVSSLSTPSDLGERISRLGLVKDLEMAGMVNTRLDTPIPANPRVTVRQVTADDREVSIPLLADAIGFSLEGARATVEALDLSQDPVRRRAYLAFVKGFPEPVAYASMIYLPDQPIVVLYCAATLEAYRGQGVYTQLVARRLADACKDGARAAVIQAVRDTSAPICQKLGFIELCWMDWYIWEPFCEMCEKI
jgi:GNAT superfamily N-acetyltransferase